MISPDVRPGVKWGIVFYFGGIQVGKRGPESSGRVRGAYAFLETYARKMKDTGGGSAGSLDIPQGFRPT